MAKMTGNTNQPSGGGDQTEEMGSLFKDLEKLK